MNLCQYKLETKRMLATIIVCDGAAVVSFVAIWGAVTGQVEYVTLAVGAIIGWVAGVLTSYFNKKTSEE